MMFHLNFPLLLFILPTILNISFPLPPLSLVFISHSFSHCYIFLCQHAYTKPDLESSLLNGTQHNKSNTSLKGGSSHRTGIEQ